MASKNRKLRAANTVPSQNRIAELRRSRELSQEQLAQLCHTTKSSMARLEAGITGLDVENMRVIAKALRVKPSELLIDDDVELRVKPEARAVLAGLAPEEFATVMQAAVDIARLVKRLSPRAGAAALQGDPRAAARVADIWNALNSADQMNILAMLESASSFRQGVATMAAE